MNEAKTIVNNLSPSISSAASGKRCKKAPPMKEPAESETKKIVIFCRVSFFNASKKTATQTQNVTNNVAKMIKNKLLILT